MLDLPIRHIYLARELVDMRKSFDTLADYVRFFMQQDPLSGAAFVFIGKRRNRLKVLIWEESGYWLFNKRLEKGTYSSLLTQQLLRNQAQTGNGLSTVDWHNLLAGIIVTKSRRLKRFQRNK